MPFDDTETTPNPAPDYTPSLPAAVKRQVAQAEEMSRQLTAEIRPPPDPPPAPPAPAVTQGEQPATPAPLAQPPAENWEHRYRTLQGKYDAEIPTMRGQVEALQRLIASLQQAQVAPPAPAPAPATTTTVVPPEDVEAYGEELINASRRWAAAEFTPLIEHLRREVAELKTGVTQRVQQVETRSAHQTVMDALDADPQLGNTWRAVNDDPAFIAWLNQADLISGQPRVRLLADAYNSGNAVRTAAFFRAYVAEQTALNPPSPPTHTPPAPPTVAPAGTGRPTLEDLAAPGRAAGAAAPAGAPPERRVWTHAAITAFYRDLTNGVYRSRPVEARRLEEDILAAAREGRLR